MMNVVCVFGGCSVEHDVSIITYFQVLNALDLKKYRVMGVYITKDNRFLYHKDLVYKMDTFKNNNLKAFKQINFIKKNNKVYLLKHQVHCVINCTHGKNLEDGTISSYFNFLGVPITSPNLTSSNMFHSKYLTKLVLNNHRIKCLNYTFVTKDMWDKSASEVITKLDRFNKVIIKPTSLGSSIGVKVVEVKNIIDALNNAFTYDSSVIIEECLSEFNEYNQAVYKYKDEVRLSKIEEVIINNDIYSYESKYINKTDRVIPAKISSSLRTKINKTTKKINSILNSNGVIRVDYLYSNNELYVNEINVIPGAFSYYLFEANQIYFQTLLDEVISQAFIEFNKNKNLIQSYDSNILSGKINKK